MPRRRRGLPVNGVVLLDKPKGLSSNHALQRVRRLFEAQKAGHTGTLDPMATGLLPICLGEATKFSAHLLEADKMYRTRVELGVITDTGDAEGTVLERREVPSLAVEDIESVLTRFRGEIDQVSAQAATWHLTDGLTWDRLAQKIKKKHGTCSTKITRKVFTSDRLNQRKSQRNLQIFSQRGFSSRTAAEKIGQL